MKTIKKELENINLDNFNVPKKSHKILKEAITQYISEKLTYYFENLPKACYCKEIDSENIFEAFKKDEMSNFYNKIQKELKL